MRRPTPADTSRPRRDARRRGRCAAGRGGNTRDTAGRTAGTTGSPNSRIARRPPGLSDAVQLARTPPPGFATLRMPNAIVAPSTDASGTGNVHRIAAHQLHARASCAIAGPSAAHAPASRRRSRRRPRVPRRARARAAASATSPVPVQTSSSVSWPVKPSDRMARRAPVAIEPGRQHRVEQVVARRDRVEHARRCGAATCPSPSMRCERARAKSKRAASARRLIRHDASCERPTSWPRVVARNTGCRRSR